MLHDNLGRSTSAYIHGDELHFNMNSPQAVLGAVAHEATHFMEKYSPKDYAALKSFIKSELTSGKFEDLVGAKSWEYLGKDKKSLTAQERTNMEGEVVAELCEKMLSDEDQLYRFAQKDTKAAKTLLSKLEEAVVAIKNAMKGATWGRLNTRDLEQSYKAFDLWMTGLSNAIEKAENAPVQTEETVEIDDGIERDALIGINDYGIEVYETSRKTRKLSWKERKARYRDMIIREYAGRTARFEKDGHFYYASFSRKDIGKAIYGERRSDQSGRDALINAGADGDVFDLVEHSRFDRASSDDNLGQSTSAYIHGDELHFNMNSPQAVLGAVAHEATHFMEKYSPKDYAALKAFIKSELKSGKFEDLVGAKSWEYLGKDKKQLTEQERTNMEGEVVAQLCEKMLSDEDQLYRFAQKDTKAAKTLLSKLEEAVVAIKNAMKGATWGRLNTRDLEQSYKAFDLWMTGLSNAIEKAENTPVQTDETTGSDVKTERYSLVTLKDGTEYVQADRQVFTSSKPEILSTPNTMLQNGETIHNSLVFPDADAALDILDGMDIDQLADLSSDAFKSVKMSGFFMLKDISRFLDKVATDKETRDKLTDLIENPHRRAMKNYADSMQRTNKHIVNMFLKHGIVTARSVDKDGNAHGYKVDKAKSAAVQAYGEGYRQRPCKVEAEMIDAETFRIKATNETGTVVASGDMTYKQVRESFSYNAGEDIIDKATDAAKGKSEVSHEISHDWRRI